MIDNGFNHAAVMYALTQPQGLVKTNPRPHITSLCIKDKDEEYEWNEKDFVYKNKTKLRLEAEMLQDRYGGPYNNNSSANISLCIQTDNNQFSQMEIPTSTAKDHPSAEEVDEKLVEFLLNKDQNNSKTVLLESSMNFILDELKSNSEKESGYRYTFLCGSEYLGQIMNNTQLTSLSFKNTDMTNDWLYTFAKHLPRSQITSLILPKIIDDPQTSTRKYKKEDSSSTDSSHDYVEHINKKSKITADDTSCNRKVQKSALEYLVSILKDTKISFLDLGGNDMNMKMLSYSLVGSKVTSLSLKGCKLQNDCLCFLARILKDTPLKSIDLSDNELNCRSLNIFVEGLEGSNITSLNLSSNKIGVDGVNCLASVLKNTFITSLDISENDFNYQSIQVFLDCLVQTNITSLSLKNNDIGSDSLMCLGKVLKKSQITSLDVSGIECFFENMSMFAPYLLDSKIKFLGLQSNSLFIDEMDILLNVIGNTQITSVDLQDNNWDLGEKNSDGINQLDRLLTNPQITSINIGLNDSRFNKFASSLIGSSVTYLGLKNLALSSKDLICLGDVLKNSKISSIDLSNNNLEDDDFKIFVPFLVDSKITSLDLSGNMPCYDGIKYLSCVLKNTKITSLSLSNCYIRCNELRHFVMHLPDSKIKSLDLSGNTICCNSFYLAFILKHTQITTLDISSQEFNVDPVFFLAEFKLYSTKRTFGLRDHNLCNLNWYLLARNLRTTKINTLNFFDIQINDEDLEYLSQGLVKSQVVNLNLTGNFIDCSGAHHLAEVLKHTRISALSLACNRIKNEGFKYLMKALCGAQLQSLNLSKNCINDDGIQGLTESIVNTQLVELDLCGNTISNGAAYNLSESFEKSNLHTMIIQIDLSSDNVSLYLVKYQNCFIEINQSLSRKGIADFAKKVYERNGIVQLILEGDKFLHLAGAFDNMDINEAAITARYMYEDGRELEVISYLEKSNIGELEIDWCHLSPKSFEKMKVVALKLRDDPNLKESQLSRLQSSLEKSNIVYLDLSNVGVDIELVRVLLGSQIISLNLSNNFVDQSFITSFANVLSATNISYINLDSNFIRFQEFKCLMNVVGNTKLCWLSLEDNEIEKDLVEDIQLSPFIVPRTDNPIEFQIRYLFKELVTLNSSTEQFEFIVPCDNSRATIIHYPRLIKFLLDRPIHKMHIYDYFFMQSKSHSLHLLNSINVFVEQMKTKFISFFDSNVIQLEEMFGYDSFVSLVKEFNRSNLTEFVEFLLLHRVLYYVDDEKHFLHPFIYKMLHEHQMPIYIEKIEPNKKQQIISYFEKHSDFDGAKEIIDLLKIKE